MIALLAPLILAAASQTALQSATSALPEDVRAFIVRRNECDHYRGEDSPDSGRRAEIDAQLTRLCTGSDRQLAGLKHKHARSPAVLRALDVYEPRIE
ncbi:MAG: hypothetical protein ABW182_08020 [Sphingomonas sp.]